MLNATQAIILRLLFLTLCLQPFYDCTVFISQKEKEQGHFYVFPDHFEQLQNESFATGPVSKKPPKLGKI